jgi:hypothetical protein
VIMRRLRPIVGEILVKAIRFKSYTTLLAGVLVVAAALPDVSAQTNPVYGPDGKFSGCVDLQTYKAGPCPDSRHFLEEGQVPIEVAFNDKKHHDLDRLYMQWCTGQDRFADGRWKLAWYSRTLYTYFLQWGLWEKHLSQINEWKRSNPESEAAKVAEAVYWRAFAWNARGQGLASSVSSEGWHLFKTRLQTAQALLEKIPSSCASKFPVLLDTLIDLGTSEGDLRRVYTDAIRRFPEYHSIYFAMARHYEPKWGGSARAYERFANEVADATSTFEGRAMYSRLYWLVDYAGGLPFSPNAGTPPTWPSLKRSLEDLTGRYPRSQHNIGQYLSVACRSNDSALYRELRTRLGTYVDAAQMLDPLEVCDLRHRWEERRR